MPNFALIAANMQMVACSAPVKASLPNNSPQRSTKTALRGKVEKKKKVVGGKRAEPPSPQPSSAPSTPLSLCESTAATVHKLVADHMDLAKTEPGYELRILATAAETAVPLPQLAC
jgi:hypothetical protein